MMRTAEKYIFDELSVEVPKDEIPASWFDENDLPMVVECTCCGSTMVLLSAMIDDNGFCFCRECAPID